jgi:hypothetical protein
MRWRSIGHGADQVARPERHHGDQEQGHLPLERARVHRQEVGDRIAEKKAEEHHHEGEPEGAAEGPDEDRGDEEIVGGGIEEALGEEVLLVVLEGRLGHHAMASRGPEAEDDDARQGDDEEHQQPQGRGRDQPADGKARLASDLRRRGDGIANPRLVADQSRMLDLLSLRHAGRSLELAARRRRPAKRRAEAETPRPPVL